jgi:hypothetical protein
VTTAPAAALLPNYGPKATMRLNEQSRGRDHESSDESSQTENSTKLLRSIRPLTALVKRKNPAAPAVKREDEEDWEKGWWR